MTWRVGIVMVALAVILGVATNRIYYYYSPDNRQVWSILGSLKQAEETGSFETAYNLMSPEFKAKTPLNRFPSECWRMNVGGSRELEMDGKKGEAVIRPAMWCGGAVLTFRKINGTWLCDGVTDWYVD